ncbi:hypothetical protein DICPUDRAFT_151784 [Dictyostelium purpureum]|uniref:ABC transporter C family protein n=1 Tax=Dictyostelium purpureum TaxID=5786 RepID=F0ZJQ5_DICPU|nr:uncharacterized protein DICPUDRAFT_151784 [Dictyostelium purpureum]EGC35823.1 hypothetical protein DICPUDRAFT_151784 [Dictyostelium purpureum]|eukprot:XP_003287660.1 hypothetical protein DICPUDRAFT_151784 [Dictyostelium purpureum]
MEDNKYLNLNNGFKDKKSFEENSNFLSRLTFHWANRIIIYCYKNILQIEDLPDLASYDKSEYLTRVMEKHWSKELKQANPSFYRALFRSFGGYFALSWIHYAISTITQFISPVILGKIIQNIIEIRSSSSSSISSDGSNNYGYIYYPIIMFACLMVGSICNCQSNMISSRTGERLKSILCLFIYKKSLRLSNSSRGKKSNGEIVNLMSNDAQRLLDIFSLVNTAIFSLPLLIVSIGLLYVYIGWVSFVALGIMILTYPFNQMGGNTIAEIRRELIKYTDRRAKVTNEIFQAIKVIKYYCWEDSFAQKAIKEREGEIKFLLDFVRYRNRLIASTSAIPIIVNIAVFCIYYAVHKDLPAEKIFPAIAYLNIFRVPFTFLAYVMSLYIQFKISIDRVTEFLLMPEIDTSHIISENNPNSPYGVVIRNSSFSWDLKKEKEETVEIEEEVSQGLIKLDSLSSPNLATSSFTLSNINIEVTGNGCLAMIIGSVGSGKSSLLQAILGEMSLIKSSLSIVKVNGSIAYSSQQAWIMNATLRDNILFGLPYEKEKYESILDICALVPDIETFPNGDLVEIGERGINLSGGQKQRVSLARAIYSDRDIYVLDDVLSAVDVQTSRHIFYKCIKGALKSKVVIFATNQLNYISHSTQVLVMKDGEVQDNGPYSLLSNKYQNMDTTSETYEKSEFIKLMKTIQFAHDQQEQLYEETKDTTANKEVNKKDIKENGDGTLVAKEERSEGSVALKHYVYYFTVGGKFLFFTVFFVATLDMAIATFSTWWLSFWSSMQYEQEGSINLSGVQFLVIFLAIGVVSMIVSTARYYVLYEYSVRAARIIHIKLFNSLIRSTMAFFDTTPIGRILNRLTKDTDTVDYTLAGSINHVYYFITSVIATLVVISIVTPMLLVPLVPISIIFYLVQYYFRFTSRELQRLESISRSPIFSHFSESLNGVVVLRAFKKEHESIVKNQILLDSNNNCYLTLQSVNQWLSLRLDLLVNIITFFCCLFISLNRSTIDIPSIGLSLSYALSLSNSLNKATITSADTETRMNSLERIVEYMNVPSEAPAIIENNRPPANWPENGVIKFDKVSLCYRPGLPKVLNQISFEIKGKEKVAICGRTGSGKTSCTTAIFRLVELAEGKIIIDNVNISEIGLKDLRENISIISQDPVLFNGTLRENLDPFGQWDDSTLWKVLEDVQLAEYIKKTEGGLDSICLENGDNFSVGQKQLICLGRALIRHTKILILDESTSSIDSHNSEIVQRCINEKFKDITVITIAHRLSSIMFVLFKYFYASKKQEEKKRKQQIIKTKSKAREELIKKTDIKQLPKSNLSYAKKNEDIKKLNLIVGEKSSKRLKESTRADWHLRLQKTKDNGPTKNTTRSNLSATAQAAAAEASSKNKKFEKLEYDAKLLETIKEKRLGIHRIYKQKRGTTKLESVKKEVKKGIERFFDSKMKLIGSAKSLHSFLPETLPEVAFIGRSNVGKSSLINALTQRGMAKTSDKPGFTQSINWYEIGSTLYLVDLPGYGFAFAKDVKLESWENITHEYLTTRKTLKCVYILVDARHGLKDSDRTLLLELDKKKIKTHIVLTKADLVLQINLAKRIQITTDELKNYHHSILPIITVSSRSLAGVADLSKQIKTKKLFVKPVKENPNKKSKVILPPKEFEEKKQLKKEKKANSLKKLLKK